MADEIDDSALFREAVGFAPDSYDTNYLLGVSYAKVGDPVRVQIIGIEKEKLSTVTSGVSRTPIACGLIQGRDAAISVSALVSRL